MTHGGLSGKLNGPIFSSPSLGRSPQTALPRPPILVTAHESGYGTQRSYLDRPFRSGLSGKTNMPMIGEHAHERRPPPLMTRTSVGEDVSSDAP